MKWFRRLSILLMIMMCSCFGSMEPIPFHYISRGAYSVVPIKEIPVYIDIDFGEADKILIMDAITQWNYALNGYVKLNVVDDHFDMEPSVVSQCHMGLCWMILKVNSNNLMVKTIDGQVTHDNGGEYHSLAWADSVGGYVVYLIRDRVDPYQITGVMLHEMGHLLGAKHDDVYLMQPHFKWNEYRCVDKFTLKMVAAWQHLPLERLNYCEYGDIGLRIE